MTSLRKRQHEESLANRSASEPLAHEVGRVSWNFWALLSIALVVLASVKVHSGGWLHRETDLYLVDHLSDRSLLSKVLCPNAADALYHQGRPLNHVLEYIDAHFIYYCTLLGRPHFLSITSYLTLFALSLAHWNYSRKLSHLDPGVTLLAILLFWTSPSIFFSGVYFRSAKPGVALLSTLLIWRLVRCFRPENTNALEGRPLRGWGWVTTLLLALGLCLMDPQGAYLTMACILTVVAMLRGPERRVALSVTSALAAAICLYIVWYWLLAPPLIRHINGFEVSFHYPGTRWHLLFASTWQFLLSFYLAEGVTLTLDTIRFYMGNIPRVLAGAVLGFAVYVYQKMTNYLAALWGWRWLPKGFGALPLIVWFSLAVLMNLLMVGQHPLLQMEDFRRTGPHRIPGNVMVLLGMTFFAHRLQESKLLSITALRVLLLALLISNIFAIPGHYAIDRNGWFKAYQEATPAMVRALKELVRLPRTGMKGEQYDFSNNARSTAKRMLRAGSDLRDEDDDYVRSSHYYNFLRSQYGLPFVQE